MDYPRSIKANSPAEVNASKRRAATFYQVLILSSFFAAIVHAEDPLPLAPMPGEPTESSAIPAAPPPAIEARNFAVKVIKRSTSGKTYLFDDLTDAKTQLGKLLLVRREPDPTTVPAMAFRVVKLYSEKNRFAAKRVRRYGTTRLLEAGASYTVLEKLGDLLITAPTAQDRADLSELETSSEADALPVTPGGEVAAPYDTELDLGTTPRERSDSDEDAEEEETESRFGASVEEVEIIDRHRQWVSAGVGYFNTQSGYFAAGGVRYGFSLGRMLFLKRAHLQDSVTAEAGVFLAKLLSWPESESGTYTVMPLVGTLRYNLHFGESFGIFFYAGMMQTFVPQFTNPVAATLDTLQKPLAAVGAGVFFRVGPGWHVRTDLGSDTFGLGLTLRF